jgi:hypothetical protein
VGMSVTVAWPVVMGIELVPVDVTSTWAPLLMVVTTVTYCWSDVETRGVVLTTAVVRTGVEEAAAALDGAAAFALLRGGADAGWPPWLEAGAGGGVEAAGASVVSSGCCEDWAGGGAEEGAGAGADAGALDAGGGRAEDAGGGAADVAGGAADVPELPPPVPVA